MIDHVVWFGFSRHHRSTQLVICGAAIRKSDRLFSPRKITEDAISEVDVSCLVYAFVGSSWRREIARSNCERRLVVARNAAQGSFSGRSECVTAHHHAKGEEGNGCTSVGEQKVFLFENE